MSFTLIRKLGNVSFGTTLSLETGGNVYALLVNGRIIPVSYNGEPASGTAPGGLTGIAAREKNGGYELILKSSDGKFVAWTLHPEGEYLGTRDVSAAEVHGLEKQLDEDLNSDGTVGAPTPVGDGSSAPSEGVFEQGRQATHLLGSSPEYTRTFRVYLLSPTSADGLVAMCGVALGATHPDQPNATVYSLEVSSENSEEGGYVVSTVTAKYKVKETDEDDWNPMPWERGDVWKFQTQGVAVPALTYYEGTTPTPLTNSAGDFFQGLTVDEAQQKITITGARQAFPSGLAAAITNCVNDAPYLGFATNCVKVQGISGEAASEVVNDQTVWYWKVTVELLARQSGWNLLLPDIGFNYIAGGEKKRATVKGPDGEDIASADPVALNGSGGLQAGGELPAILDRRIYKQITMSSYFGS